ncbi:MAG: hypothetical protein J7K85_05875 [Anaerolineaceae bacterium]|nr:hypothetical protein [Anaerolineaceae bacterium]
MTKFTTHFPFTLPLGVQISDGQILREGIMRLARARDEIEAMQDPRVEANEAYLSLVLLSHVITQLGSLTNITPEDIENFFAADLAYLEDFYMRINSPSEIFIGAVCPHCKNAFQLKIAPLSAADTD